jgi:DNA-directed RNA polymerase subunit RPC12/RpoP
MARPLHITTLLQGDEGPIVTERKSRFRHCTICGNEVDTHTVQVGSVSEVRCSACGFLIDVKEHAAEDSEATEYIAVLDHDLHVLNFIAKALKDHRLAREVLTAESGEDLVAIFAEHLAAAQPIGLVIIGTATPHLDGPSTALALRAVERGLRQADPIPIVFIYPAWVEDPLRGMISLCQPALYLNRESNFEESRLDERIERAVTHLLGQRVG